MMAGTTTLLLVHSGGKDEQLLGGEHGFTLVEVMVTVAMIMLIAVMGLGVSFEVESWSAHSRLKAAAGELYLNMQKVRATAVKENKRWAIVFEATNPERYHICSDNGDGNWTTLGDNTIVESFNLATYKHGIGYGAGAASVSATNPPAAFDAGFDFVSFNNNLVIFNPSGLPAASGYCYLSNDRNEAYAVGAMTSGAVRVKNWIRNAWQ